MTTPRTPITPEGLRLLSEHARLAISDDRVDAAAQAAQAVRTMIDGLDDLDLGDTPPATTYDARWL